MHIAICDDEAAYREDTRQKLAQALPDGEITFSEFHDGTELYRKLSEGNTNYDLIILDVIMGASNGVETAGRIRQLGVHTPLIFLSVSPEFAVYGYDVDAATYLLKPLEPERLKQVLRKLLQQLHL